MTRSARDELLELGTAIQTAVHILRPYMPLIARYEQERRDMDSVGAILNPSLFMNEERRATDAIMAPIYHEAAELVATFDRQIASAKQALEKVRR